MSGGTVAQFGTLVQAGGSVRYDATRSVYVPDHVPDGVRVAGEPVGTAAAIPAAADAAHGKQFVCYCEDVTTKDVHLSVEEGFGSLELSKRYTTVTMGPCQGKMCHRNSGLLMARELGVDPDEQRVGVTTARPPHNPTSFSLLAGRGYEPVKRTSVHHWHAERGGKMLWAGDWKRPYDYGEPEGETAAVHESLGLIDVSTLGKLIVRGPDAAAFLERIYPNRYGDMKLGPGALRDRVRRRRLDPRRRHRRAPVRDRVLRDHHVVRRGRDGAMVHLVERGLGDGLPDRERHVGGRGLQPGRAERRARPCPA